MIIDSLLDTDLYKFTMMQAVLHNAPAANVEYRFVNRDENIDLRSYAKEISQQIDYLCNLRFTKKELEYLASYHFFKPEYLEFLRIFQLNRNFVKVSTEAEELQIIIRGPWLHTIMFEVPILAIISEIYTQACYGVNDLKEGRQRLQNKVQQIDTAQVDEKFKFSDFGTRRRFSKVWQLEVNQFLQQHLPLNFSGTSNVWLAKELNLKAIGTMAHEYFQAYQALGPRLVDSQKAALQSWANEYRGDLGIALSDIYGIDAFLKDFDLYFCKLFDGVRHDSGDPIIWGEKVLQHYHKMRIDAQTKRLVFSDSLTMEKALQIFFHFKDRTNPVFGIGTHLTNDLGCEPLQIVIKMTRCNNQPVAKISDEHSKVICDDPSYLAYLRHVFNLK